MYIFEYLTQPPLAAIPPAVAPPHAAAIPPPPAVAPSGPAAIATPPAFAPPVPAIIRKFTIHHSVSSPPHKASPCLARYLTLDSIEKARDEKQKIERDDRVFQYHHNA